VADAFADRAAQGRPLAGPEAGVAAERPWMARPMEARLAHAGARRREAREDRIELARGRVGLLLRRAFADRDAVAPAAEVGEDARIPGLHAAGLPGRLQWQVAVARAAAR